MTTIFAPSGVRSTGIGVYRLVFDEAGTCPDPGLNAGERAYMLGRGYGFSDEQTDATADADADADATADADADAETVPAEQADTAQTVTATEATKAAAEKPARRTRTARKPAAE